VIVEAIVVILIGVALLNVWATWRVLKDEFASSPQRLAQIAFVWLIPVVGALVTLQLKKREPERGSGTYRETPDPGDDFGYSGRAVRRTSETPETGSGDHTPSD
jgi:hypothetical protein